MNILEVYKKYQIMPQLAEHQLRVAAVAYLICNHFSGPVIDAENILAACLLHDMGNIVKFNFAQTKLYMPELNKGLDLTYWENVKNEFLQKYGSGSHNVTAKILREIGVSQRIFELVDCVGFDQAEGNLAARDFGKKICAYSDMRVMPNGVCSLEERMMDLRERYKNHPEGAQNREVFEDALRKIEQQIFAFCNIAPEDITEQSIIEIKEQLKGFKI